MDNKKILLNDDMDLFLELEKTFFRRGEVDLLVARTGAQACNMVETYRPDLVFMDLFMPELNGDVACARLKENSDLRSIPVVLVVTGGNEEESARCRRAGADAILAKPINRNLFVATSNQFLRLTDRVAPRIAARLSVHYGTGSQRLLTQYSVNISAGGLFLETPEPLPVETPLSLEFTLPDMRDKIRCRGRVAWINHPESLKRSSLPPGMGIQFLDLSLEDMHSIQRFVKTECLTPSW